MLEEDEIDFEKLEFIIQLLLESLKDEENSVRWAAAKGLGRITQRLTKDFADQIVEQLHDLFSESETDSAWHGGCLALAELCRRGLLLPERLDAYVKVLDQALLYDVNRGNHTVGAHVRDAACYVVWSFARAYTQEIMKPHIQTLSSKLILVSLFDREINCRRAASATFQECVGRQGNFPHGIEILTEADYFTLSNRANAYLNVSCFVGQYPEYLESMLKYLAFEKLQHCDVTIRVLASQALSVLSVFNPELIIKEVLLPLIEKCFSKALHIRHGAILGVAEIIIGLSGNSQQSRQETLDQAFVTLSLKEKAIIKDSENHQKFKALFDDLSSQNYITKLLPAGSEDMAKVKGIITRIEQENLYKGKGGEIMRGGVCHLIWAMSTAKLDIDTSLKENLFKTLLDNFKQVNTEIQDEATRAFKVYCCAYLNGVTAGNNEPVMQFVHKMIDSSANETNIAMCRGYNMAFGVMSQDMLLLFAGEKLFQVLMANCVPKGVDSDDAEARKQTCKSLIQIVETMGLQNINVEIRKQIMETFYTCFEDYTVDRRGDVGSWVRQEAMVSLNKFINLIVSCNDETIISQIGADKPAFYERFVSAYLQQLNEKIDRIRE